MRHAIAADLDRLTRTFAMAFADDPLMCWMFDDAENRADHLARWFRFSLETGLPHGHLYTVGEHDAAALWSPPDVSLFAGAVGAEMGKLMNELLGKRAGEVMTEMAPIFGSHPEEPHFYLATLGATRQGEGLGSQVLEPMLRTLDSRGHPAYLESSNPRNVPFYQRHGFEVTGEIRVGGDDGPHVHFMWRAARRGG